MSARRGSNAIELALVMPAFLAFVFGILEYSFVYYHQTAVHDAVRTGCRAGATVPGRDRDRAARVTEAAMREQLAAYGLACAEHDCAVEIDWLLAPPSEVLSCRLRATHHALTGVIPHPDVLGAAALVPIEVQR